MGHGIALALARQGCAVACVDVASHEHSLRRACDSITASTGSTATAFTADCTDRAELAAAGDAEAALVDVAALCLRDA